MTVQRTTSGWKLETTTVQVPIDGGSGAPDPVLKVLAIGGEPVNGATTVTVFPGLPAVGSSSRLVDVTADVKPVLLEGLSGTPAPAIVPIVTLNDVGRQAALDTVIAFERYCFNGGPYPPECCPNRQCERPDRPGTTSVGIDKTRIKLTKLVQTSGITYDFDPATMIVSLTGTVNWLADVPRNSGPIWNDYSITIALEHSRVNMAVDPPVFIPKYPSR